MTDPLSFVEAAGRLGLPTVAAATIIWLFVKVTQHQQALTQTLLQQVLHGDGNGGPSIAKVLSRLDEHGQRLTVVEGEVKDVKAEVKDLRREHDARGGQCKPLRRANAAGGEG